MHIATWFVTAFLTGLLHAQAPAIDEVLGAWEGTLEHNGETRQLVVEFTRVRDKVWLVASTPAIHAWRFGIAPAEMSGRRVTAGPAVFEFDPSAGTLVTTLPPDLVPKYSLRATFHRRPGAVTPDVRPPIDGPRRDPSWKVDLGAPLWADVAVDGDLVVAGADDGRLHAVDASGRERWIFKAGGAIRARAAFVGGDVVVQADDGVLYRLDGRTGEPRWRVTIAAPSKRVPLDDPASRYENRASAAAVAGERLYVGTHDGRILAVDARRGTIVWEFKAKDGVIATPVVAHGRVYCGSFDGQVYALDAASGSLAWTHDTGGPVTSAVAVSGRRILAGSRSFDFEALDAATGHVAWTKYFWFSWVESPASVFGSAVCVGSSDAGTVSSIDAVTGRARWTADVQGSAWGQPAVTDSTVYEGVAGVLHYIAPHRGSLVALDRANGKVRWWYSAAEPNPSPQNASPYGFAGSVAVGRKFVYAAGLDGFLYAFLR